MRSRQGAATARKWLAPPLLALLSILMTAALGEVVLRVAGFEFTRYPVVQFGWPDPLIFWVQKDYDERLAAARDLKPSVVFLGDSCTEFGAYPAMTLERLSTRRPDLAKGVSLGVGGWSSEQGKRQLRRDVLTLHPRFVTIYFGWNDHWIALGPPDAQIRKPLLPAAWSQRSRLAQVVEKVWFGKASDARRRPNRVSLSHYEENLGEMIRMLHEANAEAVLITAPANHVSGHEPAYLLERHLRRLEDLIPLHREYVDKTRTAGRAAGAVVCDAAAAFEHLPPPAGRYFNADGIHLTQEGNRALASLLADCIEQAAPPPETER
jgi:lysophospholipase L1-like esterase